MNTKQLCLSLLFLVSTVGQGVLSAQPKELSQVQLPAGVRAVWDLNAAYRETTPSRERICINGLWQWQPALTQAGTPPPEQWGYFKVPGSWPGITDYMQKDSQTLFAHPEWKNVRLGSVTTAWYRREISIPHEWAGRRIALTAEYFNSYGVVYIDHQKVGELRFPAAELDLTEVCRPGTKHDLAVFVAAMPLKAVMLSYTDSASARELKGSVQRRGFCGDVFLVSTPRTARISDVAVRPSFRKQQCTFNVGIQEPSSEVHYSLRARISRQGKTIREFNSPRFGTADLTNGQFTFTQDWKAGSLWDTHTPENTFRVEVALLDSKGTTLDTSFTERFGFREFWIEGRDFYLNGTRLFLSAVPLDNAQVGAALSAYDAARESLQRLQSFGINYVYTHNYGCEPGAHLGFEEILNAADDVGMLVGFSQPHFSHYDWKSADAERTNGYAQHAAFYTRVARNHPSVVMYAMSHNATGYNEDMNPDMIDGLQDSRDTWALRNSALARRAEDIVQRLDPSRIIYHHASGNLGSMHVMNFYPNFVPVQELSDWFEHWSAKGVKPAFMCEYGAPFTWDWTMYRGWYKGEREFGSAAVPWEFCLAEWNAQFFGDQAFVISEAEKANLRWEAGQFRVGKVWHRWDYPNEVGSSKFDERYPVFERYITDNWRAFRAWGVSGISPWEYGHFWKLRPGVDKRRRSFQVNWQHLQRPGFSPDYIDQQYERMDLAYERDDWIATAAAQSLLRHNRQLLAFIGGKSSKFTSKDHNFLPGEVVQKQIIVINNSRVPVRAQCNWAVSRLEGVQGAEKLSVPPGEQKRLEFQFALPPELEPGTCDLTAKIAFDHGEIQQDTFSFHVLPHKPAATAQPKVALFDPKGETTQLLRALGTPFQVVQAVDDLSAFDVLIVGKAALTTNGIAPNLSRVPEGLKVIVFEQSSSVLEKRLGFRVQEYGLREVFPRIQDHPALAGLNPEHLANWRGEATILSSRLKYETRPRHGATVQWCGLPVTRLWRCGNQGNVASVLIEKPGRGDFRPVIDGGFGLQYSPLLEHPAGKGLIVFCQLDVTGRTETEPAAEILARNLLDYVGSWKPSPARKPVYVGNSATRDYLKSTGVPVATPASGTFSADELLVLGPGASEELAPRKDTIADWLRGGGHVLAIGLDDREANAILPLEIKTKNDEHISATFHPFQFQSLLAGVSPADVHNRDPREFPLVVSGAKPIGNGVLATSENLNIVFCQIEPWKFASATQANLRRTHRRAAFLLSRLMANLGVAPELPLLDRWLTAPLEGEQRWLTGFYVDDPQEWDDPYRAFRW